MTRLGGYDYLVNVKFPTASIQFKFEISIRLLFSKLQGNDGQ